jgi:uncharacterized protein (DUF169 family)
MLSSFPVAVKMLEDVKMLNEVKDERGKPLRQVNNKITVCQFLGQAHYLGVAQGGTKETLSACVSGGAYLGFWELPEEYPDRYVGGYFPTKELARETVATCPRFEPGKYAAMIASSLERTPVDPDVVIFFCNAAQLLVLTAAYLSREGGKIDAEFCMVGACSQPIVSPMKTGKPNIFYPTNGARILAFPSENELMFSIPGGKLEEFLEGLDFVYRGRLVRYPTTWQHISWEPQGPIVKVIGKEKS